MLRSNGLSTPGLEIDPEQDRRGKVTEDDGVAVTDYRPAESQRSFANPVATTGTTGPKESQRVAVVEKFISVPELARRLGRSKESLYQAARRGEIPGAFLIGRKWGVNWLAFQAATANAHGPLKAP